MIHSIPGDNLISDEPQSTDSEVSNLIDKLKTDFSKVFRNEQGCCNYVTHEIPTFSNAKPVAIGHHTDSHRPNKTRC
jgi:hypothetical protein